MIAEQERERGLTRIMNFTDAIVAIAATILVLPLVDTATDIGTKSVGTLLSDDGQKLFSFALSFVVICRFWLTHHNAYEHVIDYTSTLIWVNCLWLLSIVFLPFPTELIGAAGSGGEATVAIYIGTMAVTTIANLCGQWIIIRTPKLQAETVRGTMSFIPAANAAVGMTAALILAVAVPSVGLWALLVNIPAGLLEKRMMRYRAPHR
jgi:uncharacterized membrane protein